MSGSNLTKFTLFQHFSYECNPNFTLVSSDNGADFKSFNVVKNTYLDCDALPTLGRREGIPFYLNSYFSSPVILVTLVCNTFVCIVLTRKTMLNTTNVILLGMALADLLTAFFPLPFYILTLFLTKDHDFYNNTVVLLLNVYGTILLPTIFHTTNIWLTVVLAIQRSIYIFFPMKVQTICTITTSTVITIVVFIMSGLYHQPLAFYNRFVQLHLLCETNQAVRVLALRCPIIDKKFFIQYYYSRLVVVNCIPCVLLTIFTVLLVVGLKQTERRRQALISRKSVSRVDGNGSNNNSEGKNTTIMLLVILVIFLLVEIPMAVILLVYTVQMARNPAVQPRWITVVSPIWNLVILVSYPLNFFVYCRMSTQFRKTFGQMFGCPMMEQSQKKMSNAAFSTFQCERKITANLGSTYTQREQTNGNDVNAFMKTEIAGEDVDIYVNDSNNMILQQQKQSLLISQFEVDDDVVALEDEHVEVVPHFLTIIANGCTTTAL